MGMLVGNFRILKAWWLDMGRTIKELRSNIDVKMDLTEMIIPIFKTAIFMLYHAMAIKGDREIRRYDTY